LPLAPEHRRGHGALYDAVNGGRVDIARLRRCLAELLSGPPRSLAHQADPRPYRYTGLEHDRCGIA